MKRPPSPPRNGCHFRNGEGNPAVEGRALDDARLRAFLRRRRRTRRRVAQPELGASFRESLTLARRLVPSRSQTLLLDRPGPRPVGAQPLTVIAALGSDPDARLGREVITADTPLGDCLREGRVRTLAGAPAEGVAVAAGLGRGSVRSALLAPIRLERAVCGLLLLAGRRGRAGYDARDEALAALLAQNVSRGILNAVDVLKQNELAHRDGLTGLRNVRGLAAYLGRAVRGARRRRGGDAAVLFVDVDRLKRLNDAHGHRAGSEVLRRVGRALHRAVDGRGRVFRFGGDEFVAVCPTLDQATAEALGDAVLRGIVGGRGPGPRATVSLGVATVRRCLGPDPGPREAERLLSAADRALYRAKRGGRARLAAAGPGDADPRR